MPRQELHYRQELELRIEREANRRRQEAEQRQLYERHRQIAEQQLLDAEQANSHYYQTYVTPTETITFTNGSDVHLRAHQEYLNTAVSNTIRQYQNSITAMFRESYSNYDWSFMYPPKKKRELPEWFADTTDPWRAYGKR